jgi:hypothetical protein
MIHIRERSVPTIKPSPPFSLATHDWVSLGFGAAFAVVGALCAFATATLIPTLQAHEANQLGQLIVTMLASFVPWLLNFAKKYLTDTTTVVKLIIFAAVLSLASCTAQPSFAGDTAIVVPSLSTGSYLLTVDATGGVTLSPLDKVVRVNPMPPGPIPPTPGPLTDNAVKIRDAAAKVTADSDRATTAKGLAELYRQLAKLVRNNQVPDQQSLVMAVRMATDNFLSSRGAGAAAQWVPVRDVFSTEWTVLSAKTPPATLLDFAGLLEEAASGLDASAPNKAIDPALLQLIMQIIQLVLQLLQPHA